ncbi:hypothetical protein LDENG_00069190 [Lucifuga dentata]|nr:hypothetical protein LDENG_00069190 [Lucifuga dentata]
MSAVKALQQWCRIRCEGYRDVNITNMTTSFRDGLAFCALIHRHRPDLINFDSLKKENVYENNKLAFKVAEVELGIPALLDAEDMVALKIPDRLSILTYVSQYYNYFHGRSPIGGMGGIKRPADSATDETSGKKNQPVVAKMFPSSKPSSENFPPPSSQITTPKSSPRQARNAMQEVSVERSHRTGTLSNKCVSCNKHVHLVQRHLVEGKLYHRNCAKLLPSKTSTPLRDLTQNTSVSRFTPHPDPTKSNTTTPTPTPSMVGPSWLKEKSSTPSSTPSSFSTLSPLQPRSRSSSPSKGSQTAFVSKLTFTSEAPRTTYNPPNTTTTSITIRPNASPWATRDPVILTTSVTTRPTAAPHISTTAAKTLQSKLKFFETGSDSTSVKEENKSSTKNVETNRWLNAEGQGQNATAGQVVSVVVSGAGVGNKDASVSRITGEDEGKSAALGGSSGKVYSNEGNTDRSKTKAEAAALISKKLAEENNNTTSKPTWTMVGLKKTDNPEEGVRGRKKLKADPSVLADLQTSPVVDTSNSSPTPVSRGRLHARSPDKGCSKPRTASLKITAASESTESPAEWRSRLKPVSKETNLSQWSPLPSNSKPTDISSKPWANRAGRSQATELTADSSSSHLPPSISITPPASKGFLNGQSGIAANATKSESKISKTKSDYIPKKDIMKELQEIEDKLNELEKRGVELEMRLRRSEEEGEDNSLMDELMIEWFVLIRNKQVAMRRESELVYIGRTQDLEEEQPSVEQELRRLMEKPEHLKTTWERKREKQLMAKLMEIVNDRNAIVDGLDEDRLREEEEDEQLNKLVMNFHLKKDKSKKKSPMSKLFSWGNKKEG